MLFNIPQFIDQEDKIVGPLTAKQLGWMFGAGAILLVLWNLLDFTAFILAALVTGAVFGAFAFLRPYNQSFLSFLLSVFSFSFKPKVYIWKRIPKKETVIQKAPAEMKAKVPQKQISENKIEEISNILDKY
jgi:hypothetical protein